MTLDEQMIKLVKDYNTELAKNLKLNKEVDSLKLEIERLKSRG